MYILIILVFTPSLTVYFFNQNNENFVVEKDINELEIIDNLEILEFKKEDIDKKQIKKNNFEDYIVGVVAAEMPISFEEEALKAQAVAARTYAYKRIEDINKPVDYRSIGQAYNTLDELKNKWGSNFEKYYNKVANAVYNTNGIIMTYENIPIEAVFHSTSAGITEVSENIWGRNLPYIKSVDSKVDENAPNFTYTTKVSKDKIVGEISKKFPKIDKNKIIDSFKITKRSNADYVLEVDILW